MTLEEQGCPRRDGGERRAPRAVRRPVPDGARQLGHERLDRDGRRRPRHHDHRDPDRDRPLHAGDGDADGHRREDRLDHRSQAGLHDRARDLLLRFADDGPVAEPRRPALRVVAPGRDRGGADHARDRRPGRGELPARRAAPRLRPGRGGRGDRDRRRTADRRARDDLRVVAVGVRRRGRRRGGHLPVRPPRSPTRRSRSAPTSTCSGSLLWALGMGLVVFGVLRSSEWGWISAERGRPLDRWACRRSSG